MRAPRNTVTDHRPRRTGGFFFYFAAFQAQIASNLNEGEPKRKKKKK
jgi:hypothetical protein